MTDSNRVWSKGDKCLALFKEDGKYYPGCILNIVRSPDLKVTVHFDGYTKEDAETVDISQIKMFPKSPKQKQSDVTIVSGEEAESLFKPLCGKEKYRYLQTKYKDLSDEETEAGTSCSSLKIPKRKGVVASGGQSKNTRSDPKSIGKERKLGVSGDKTKNTRKNLMENIRTSAPRKEKEDKDKNTNKSINLELSQDTFDSQKPSTSRIALQHDKKPHYLSDSSDDSLDCRFTSVLSKLDKAEELKVSVSDSKNHRSSSTDGDIADLTGDGFTDYDLEKPRFKFTLSAAKVPYTLSGPDEKPVIQVPATINQYLRDYQRNGIQFMYDHYKKGRGAILGDDMGLGKTVQVIGFLAALLRKHGNRVDVLKHKPKFIRQMSDNKIKLCDEEGTPKNPFLIIGPGSVLYNWMDELETWGYFTVGKFHGSDKDHCLEETKKGKYEVVVTTYETYRDNQEDLNSVSWTAVIVDEVHKIKGQQAQITQSLKAINTYLRIGLTGTALQNDMMELWCILDWAQPNCLGECEEFRINYVEPIKQGQKIDATKRELAEARKLKEEFSTIRNKMLLRRTKQLIADQLPTKDDNVVYCRLTPFQEQVYRCLLDHPLMNTVMKMDEPCYCGSGRITGLCCNKLVEFNVSFRAVMFTFLSLFMKVGNHVGLLVPDKRTEDNLKPLTKHILKQIYDKFPQYFSDSKEASFKTLSDPKYCGKMKVMKGLLSVFYKDHSKVLVFSYSTRVLDIFEQYLMTTEYEYRRLDGSTSVKKRMHLVREFNRDPNIFIFLISTKAGGLGLNLTGANRVIIFDPNWNPTHDLQAQDRAYRIGQRRNVKVYRLISSGTIEENMYLRQIYKQQLDSVAIQNLNANRYFKGIAGDRARQGELFGVKNMFEFRTGDQCLTLEILNENERVETELVGFTVSKYVSTDLQQGEGNSEDEISTTEDEMEKEHMEDSLLELFGIRDSDFRLNTSSVTDSTDENDCTVHKSTYKKGSARGRTKTKKRQEQEVNPSGHCTQLKKSSPSFSSVSDVFEQCGVVHIHENRQLVGGSKAEDHMTKCAIQDVYELHQNSQIPAVYCDPLSESDDSVKDKPTPVKRARGKKSTKEDHNSSRSVVIGSNRVLIGQTPKAIRLKHFEEMRQFLGTSSAVELSERILSGTVQSRMTMLMDFYTKDKPEFKQIFDIVQDNLEKGNHAELGKHVMPSGSKKKTTTHLKRKKRKKENETLGISFVDLSDSESEDIKNKQTLENESSRTESLDVGMPITSKCRQKLSPFKVSGKSRQKDKTVRTKTKAFSGSSILTLDSVDNNIQEAAQVHQSDDFEELIKKIGQQEDVQVPDDNMSVLDDIFSSFNKSNKKRGKPLQKNKQLKPDSESTSMTEDEDNPLLDTSTLKEEGIDVFSDPVKWKRRQPKKRVSLVDQMVSDAADDYDDLFTKGKMKKVKKSNNSNMVSAGDPSGNMVSAGDPSGNMVSSNDPSASLF